MFPLLPLFCAVLQFLLAALSILCFARPSVATEAQEQRGMCGNYSYALPQGFSTNSMEQPYRHTISLTTREGAFPMNECRIICIRREKVDDRPYLTGTLPLIVESPMIKHGLIYDPVAYEGTLPDGIRLYYDEYPKNKKVDELNWGTALIEMSAADSSEHIILYYRCQKDYHEIPRVGRTTLLVEMTYCELRERIMNFVRSIRREQ